MRSTSLQLRSVRILAAAGLGLVLALLLWAAAPPAEAQGSKNPDTHQVKKGDTLWSISRRYGLNHRDLARINGLGTDYKIRIGQVLLLREGAAVPPKKKPKRKSDGPPEKWLWPTLGSLVTRFGEGEGPQVDGIDIQGGVRQLVRASAAGTVSYSGSGLVAQGYGNIIILDHSGKFRSVYGRNSEILIRTGDKVKAGQPIGRLGADNDGQLLFQIRHDGHPIDPLQLLPAR